jgi:DNA-binding FadR family transcriptional regulator
MAKVTITTRNLRVQVAEALALQILNGTYAPGETLPTEDELAQLTGVSRTTLRGAVQSLAAKGLLDVSPSRGTRVQAKDRWNLLDADVIDWRLQLGITTDLVREIYELRECFEPRASYFAAQRGNEVDQRKIQRAFRDLSESKTKDEEAATVADVNFHMAILSSCGNDFIVSFGRMMSAMLRMSFKIARSHRPLSADDIERHRAIADAILAHDGDVAESFTRQLLHSSKKVQMDAAAEVERSTRVSRTMAMNLTK